MIFDALILADLFRSRGGERGILEVVTGLEFTTDSEIYDGDGLLLVVHEQQDPGD